LKIDLTNPSLKLQIITANHSCLNKPVAKVTNHHCKSFMH